MTIPLARLEVDPIRPPPGNCCVFAAPRAL
jgi:hypothetical protein